MRVNVRLLGVYILCLFISYLAGIYFGPSLLFIFVFLIMLPAASVFVTVVPFLSLRVDQRWGRAMPVRGETVTVSIIVSNPTWLPAHAVRVDLTGLPGEQRADPISLHLPAFAEHTAPLALRYDHRGTYHMGVSSVQQNDPIGLVHLQRCFPPREVLVYPRLYEIRSFSTVVEDILGRTVGSSGAGAEDPGLFVQLREYRDGESIRHISWRKYASTGKPFLREYERQQKNGAALYLDTRPGEGAGRREQEDTSLEIFLAIARYLFLSSVPLTCRTPSNMGLERSLLGRVDFERVLHEAVNARFDQSSDLLTLLAADARAGLLDRKIVIVVSHRFDAGIRGALENGTASDLRLVLNVTGMGKDEQETIRIQAPGVFGERVELYVVDSPDRIIPVLEGSFHAYERR